jgi:prepilin-type N-terminal cleavage/methylation domain-containing protein
VKSQKGLTLIEILAASAMLGIIIVAFMGATNFIGNNGQKMDRSVEALNVAEEQLNISRRNIKLNIAPVTNQTVSDFSVNQQIFPIGTAPAASLKKNHVSLQTIVPITPSSSSAPVPYVLIVTVGWE